MNTVSEAIQAITYRTEHLPREAFRFLGAHREEALPYLREALNRAIEDSDALLDSGYELHFYALFLLAEWKDTGSFEQILALASLPEKVLDDLIGDTITSGLSDIIYSTYDGNLDALKTAIRNPRVDEYASTAMLEAMAQLYLDRTIAEEDWRNFLKSLIYEDSGDGYLYTETVSVICRCHFVDMLQDIEHLYAQNRVDEETIGDYEESVDVMFQYDDYHNKPFCTLINAEEYLSGWAMFQEEEPSFRDKIPDIEKIIKGSKRNIEHMPARKKVGRNDPCPCGSGKKYKFCCLNKPRDPVMEIESSQEREKWLKDYPKTGTDRVAGRVYLEDYFDPESIEIDKLVYLALMHRSISLWHREDPAVVQKRKITYLWGAYQKYKGKMDKENFQNTEAYDEHCAIHYKSGYWLSVLCSLLEEAGDSARLKEVKQYMESCRRI